MKTWRKAQMSCGGEHMLCNGVKEAYRVGGLSIELEKCPHHSCGAWFYASPTQNLQHQDSVHWVFWLMSVGHVGVYTFLRGALVCHIIHGQNGPGGSKEI